MPVAVTATYHTPLKSYEAERSLEEMIFSAATGVLDVASVELSDIDAIVLSTADQTHGRVIESMVASGAAGGAGRDVTTIASAGEHGLVYAALRLLAGLGDRILVLSWGKPSESLDPDRAELVAAEPFFMRPHGMNESVAAALQATLYTKLFPAARDAAPKLRDTRQAAHEAWYGAGALGQDRREGQVAWPLAADDLPRRCDAAVGVVLERGEAARSSDKPAWIRGLGWSTEPYDLGTRDLTRLPALDRAATRALGDTVTVDQLAAIEVTEISSVGAFVAAESLGVITRGACHDLIDKEAVNRSGGSLPAHPGNGSGLLRMAYAAESVRESDGEPRFALGAATYGFAGQGATAILFSNQPEGT